MTGGPVQYEPIALSSESTVVAKFIAEPSAESGYQSEADLERSLIEILKEQAYEHLRIGSEADLIANLRAQLEALNARNSTGPSISAMSGTRRSRVRWQIRRRWSGSASPPVSGVGKKPGASALMRSPRAPHCSARCRVTVISPPLAAW